MAIIKHKTASGITYCYDSTPKWDPVKKQARPQKKYLGRWDEETQTIIPTTGKRGRKRKEGNGAPSADTQDMLLRECQEKLLQTQNELKEAKEQVSALSQKNKEYAEIIERIRKELEKIV